MVRITGVDLPNNKRAEVALTYIFGVGISKSRLILKEAGISQDTKMKDFSEDELVRLREKLSMHKTEGDLRREISMNIKRLMEIGSYRGTRHKRNLPCRGQRTSTNARTRRLGKKRTVANKKK